MDARVLVSIWYCLPSILNVINPTVSTSLKQDDYDKNQSTENFQPAVPTERLENLAYTVPMESVYKYEPVAGRSRFYRNIDSEAITSTDPIVVPEHSSSFEFNDSTDKYTATTNLINNNSPIIPLTSTEPYDSTEPDQIVSEENGTVMPIMTTKNYFDVPNVTDNDNAVTPDYIKNSDYIGFTSNLNQTTATLNPQLSAKENNEVVGLPNKSTEYMASISNEPTSKKQNPFFETPNEMAVIGISNMENLTEKIMRIYPSKVGQDQSVMDNIHNMLESTSLKIETEDYITQLHQRYEYLPLVEEDNFMWTKFSRSVVERFVLDFCRNYPHYSETERSIARWYKVEEYNSIYDTTLQHLQEKKGQTAIQFAAPVRRAIDIYKAIIDLPIGIVQSKCKDYMPLWLCKAEYVVGLVDFSDTCEHAWHHAEVHVTILKSIRQANGTQYPANEVIAELNSRMASLDQNDDANYLFEFIIQTLDDLRKSLREPLLEQAKLYNLVRQLQSEDKLKCLRIDEQGL